MSASAAEGDEAVLRVQDNGIGIAPELLPRIFELFVQGRQASDRAEGGLGLGLTIVRSLVELHGGSVERPQRRVRAGAASSWCGCRCWSSAAAAAPAVIVDRRRRADSRRPGAAVLVVDDNAGRAPRCWPRCCTEPGYDAAVAHDGPAALRLAAAASAPRWRCWTSACR